jgi:hypothetical protein
MGLHRHHVHGRKAPHCFPFAPEAGQQLQSALRYNQMDGPYLHQCAAEDDRIRSRPIEPKLRVRLWDEQSRIRTGWSEKRPGSSPRRWPAPRFRNRDGQPAIVFSNAAACSGIHNRRGARAGDRSRRQHRDLQRTSRSSAAAVKPMALPRDRIRRFKEIRDANLQ